MNLESFKGRTENGRQNILSKGMHMQNHKRERQQCMGESSLAIVQRATCSGKLRGKSGEGDRLYHEELNGPC